MNDSMVKKNNDSNEHFPERLAVVGVILRAENFLVIKRSLTESAPGACCFPGGGIESGESESEALIRELHEEIGIRSAKPIRCLWRNRTMRNVNIAWWLAEIPSEETIVANPREVAAFYWWTPQEMVESGMMLQSNLEFLNALAAGEIQV